MWRSTVLRHVELHLFVVLELFQSEPPAMLRLKAYCCSYMQPAVDHQAYTAQSECTTSYSPVPDTPRAPSTLQKPYSPKRNITIIPRKAPEPWQIPRPEAAVFKIRPSPCWPLSFSMGVYMEYAHSSRYLVPKKRLPDLVRAQGLDSRMSCSASLRPEALMADGYQSTGVPLNGGGTWFEQPRIWIRRFKVPKYGVCVGLCSPAAALLWK